MPTTHHMLAITGSLRAGSTATAALRTAQAEAPAGIMVTRFGGLGSLPPFNPDDDVDPPPAPVQELREAIAAAHSVLLSTPEYATALPGVFKNLLDWTVGSDELSGRPVGWINTSVSPTGAVAAHEELHRVLAFLQADVVEEACADVAVPRASVGPDGTVSDDELRARIAEVVRTLARHGRSRRR